MDPKEEVKDFKMIIKLGLHAYQADPNDDRRIEVIRGNLKNADDANRYLEPEILKTFLLALKDPKVRMDGLRLFAESRVMPNVFRNVCGVIKECFPAPIARANAIKVVWPQDWRLTDLKDMSVSDIFDNELVASGIVSHMLTKIPNSLRTCYHLGVMHQYILKILERFKDPELRLSVLTRAMMSIKEAGLALNWLEVAPYLEMFAQLEHKVEAIDACAEAAAPLSKEAFDSHRDKFQREINSRKRAQEASSAAAPAAAPAPAPKKAAAEIEQSPDDLGAFNRIIKELKGLNTYNRCASAIASQPWLLNPTRSQLQQLTDLLKTHPDHLTRFLCAYVRNSTVRLMPTAASFLLQLVPAEPDRDNRRKLAVEYLASKGQRAVDEKTLNPTLIEWMPLLTIDPCRLDVLRAVVNIHGFSITKEEVAELDKHFVLRDNKLTMHNLLRSKVPGGLPEAQAPAAAPAAKPLEGKIPWPAYLGEPKSASGSGSASSSSNKADDDDDDDDKDRGLDLEIMLRMARNAGNGETQVTRGRYQYKLQMDGSVAAINQKTRRVDYVLEPEDAAPKAGSGSGAGAGAGSSSRFGAAAAAAPMRDSDDDVPPLDHESQEDSDDDDEDKQYRDDAKELSMIAKALQARDKKIEEAKAKLDHVLLRDMANSSYSGPSKIFRKGLCYERNRLTRKVNVFVEGTSMEVAVRSIEVHQPSIYEVAQELANCKWSSTIIRDGRQYTKDTKNGLIVVSDPRSGRVLERVAYNPPELRKFDHEMLARRAPELPAADGNDDEAKQLAWAIKESEMEALKRELEEQRRIAAELKAMVESQSLAQSQVLPGQAPAAAAAASVVPVANEAAQLVPVAMDESGDECKLCEERPRDHAMQCGHRICEECADAVKNKDNLCPWCRAPIQMVIKLFDQ